LGGTAPCWTELDPARRRVEPEVTVVGLAVREGVDGGPRHPLEGALVAHLEQLVRAARLERRDPTDLEGLGRRSVAGPELLVAHARRVLRGYLRAHDVRGDRVDERWSAVAPVRQIVLRQAAAHPVPPLARHLCGGGEVRHLQLDLATARVEALGGVLEHPRGRPALLARQRRGGGFPLQRRPAGVDAGAPRLRSVDADAQHEAVERLGEPEVQPVARSRRGAEPDAVRSGRPADALAHGQRVHAPAAAQRDGDRAQRADHERLGDLERDRPFARRRARRDLGLVGGDRDLALGRAGEAEVDVDGRRDRRCELDVEQPEQRDMEPLGNAVDAVAQHLDHRRELLDQRDAGIGDVVLVPLRAAQRDALAGLRDQVLEAQVVERLQLERHDASSAGTT
jgi:hypothetical protein